MEFDDFDIFLLDIGVGVYENGMEYSIWYIVCMIVMIGL